MSGRYNDVARLSAKSVEMTGNRCTQSRLQALLVVLVACVLTSPAHAETINVAATDDWAARINALKPGDTAILAPGRYTGSPTIQVAGQPGSPITVRGSGVREAIVDGESSNHALRITSSHLVIENILFTNPSPYGIDLDGRNPGYIFADPARPSLAEGIVMLDSDSVVVQQCRFQDIATRGIINIRSHNLTFAHNIFLHVGDDTAGGDITAGSGSSSHTVRGNLFAGNVDGVVHHGAGSGHLIERNLFVYGTSENGIDLKYHWQKASEPPSSTIQFNVIYANHNAYSGVEIQDASKNIRFLHNIVRNAAVFGLQIRGRSVENPGASLENIEIIGNWFDGGTTGINVRVTSSAPANVNNAWILHNVFTNFSQACASVSHGTNLFATNNIFSGCGVTSSVPVNAHTNLYDGVSPWAADGSPLTGTPVYATAPVGLLAAGSPGKGQASAVAGQAWGNDVGLPAEAANLGTLESSILAELAGFFSTEEIAAGMAQGGLPYQPSSPNQAPTIDGTPTATPNPVVVSNTTQLKVVASDPDSGPSPLTYTWSSPSDPGVVSFDPPGVAETTATFTSSGTHTLRVLVSDGVDQVSAELTVVVDLGEAPAAVELDDGDWTTLEMSEPDANFGGEEQLRIKNDSGSPVEYSRHVVGSWTLSDAITSPVQAVEMCFTWHAPPPSGNAFSLYAGSRSDVVETEATWNVYRAGAPWDDVASHDAGVLLATHDFEQNASGEFCFASDELTAYVADHVGQDVPFVMQAADATLNSYDLVSDDGANGSRPVLRITFAATGTPGGDAGPGAGGGPGGDAGPTGDGGPAGLSDDESVTSDGCGCRIRSGSPSGPVFGIGLLLAAFVLRRRARMSAQA